MILISRLWPLPIYLLINKELKKLDISEDVLKNNETDVQELTDRYTKKVEQAFQSKESEIMKV